MSTSSNKPNFEPARSEEVSRRDFLKLLGLSGLVPALGMGGPFTQQESKSATLSPLVSSRNLPRQEPTNPDFLKVVPGQRNPVFLNFSNPREIRGIAARGRYVYAAALNMIGRIDTKDNKYTVYDASILPPYTGQAYHRPLAVNDAGELWVGTETNGVYRFDGAAWTQFMPLLPQHGKYIPFVSTITINSHNELWIGGYEGLIHLSKTFDPITYNSRVAAGQPGYQDGEVLLELRGADQKVDAPIDPGLETNDIYNGGTQYNITGIVEDIDAHGLLWVGVGGLDYRRVWAKRDPVTRQVFLTGNPTNPANKIERINDGPSANRIPGGDITDMTVTSDGNLWSTTVYGAVLMGNSTAPDDRALPADGGIDFKFYDFFNTTRLYGQYITDANNKSYYIEGGIFSLVRDYDGNLWFCNRGLRGLARTRTLPPKSDADMDFYTPPSADYGTHLPHYSQDLAFNYGAIDGDNNFWVASTAGIIKFIRPGQTGANGRVGPDFEDPIELFNSGQRSDTVYVVAIGQDKNLYQRRRWFGSDHGLYSYDGQNWRQYGPDAAVKSVVVDKNNTVWFVVKDSGIYRLDGENLSGPISPANTSLLALGKDGLTVWAGTDAGVYRLNDGSFILDSLSGQVITALAINPTSPTEAGALWAATSSGLIYNGANQVNKSPASGPITTLAIGSDGAVWFSTGDSSVTILTAAASTTINPSGQNINVKTIEINRHQNRVWIGLDGGGVYIYNPNGTLFSAITSQNGLVYNVVNGLAFEPNPYVVSSNQPYEDLVWVATRHGISQFTVAVPNTGYEPNNDRFVAFPLALDSSTGTTSPTSPRLYSGSDIDWYKVRIGQRFSRLIVKLDQIPVGSDFDLVVYPPARRSSTNSAIFGEMDGIDGACQNNAPVGTTSEHPGSYLNDSGNITDRHSFLAYSLNEGSQPEYVNILVSGPPGDYQVGIIPYLGKVTQGGGYQLNIQVVPPGPMPDYETIRQRLYPMPFTPRTGVQTLLLTHTGRLGEIYGAEALLRIKTSLANLANWLKTHRGWGTEIYDLASDPFVADAYRKWYLPGATTNPALLNPNPEAANQVADAIHELIVEKLANNADLQYVVLVGSDEVIPYRRVLESDNLVVGSEKKYPADAIWPLPATTPLATALSMGYHLTDSFYGSLRTNLKFNGQEVYIPEVALGRLVERPEEIINAIQLFMTNNGVTTLGSALVTGYDFLQDQANAITTRLGQAGVRTDTLIGDTWLASSDLNNQLVNRHDLIALNGHFDHTRTLAAGYDQAGVDGGQKLLDAKALVDQIYNLAGALLVSVGCHSGLNVPTTGSTDPNDERLRDFAQTLLSKGATLVGNTGYGYGDSDEIVLSELLIKLVVDFILSGQAAVGKALMLAKQAYLHASGPYGFSEYDIKVLDICTLYGLPMYEFKTPVPVPLETARPRLATVSKPATAQLPQTSKKRPGAGTAVTLPADLTNFNITVDLPDEQWQLEEKENGSTYKLPGGAVHAPPLNPVVPKLVLPIDDQITPGNYAHGVLLVGGRFENLYDFMPLIASPTADIDLNSGVENAANRDFFGANSWSPQVVAFLNSQQRIQPGGGKATGYKLGQAPLSTNLVVVPLQVRNPGRARRYQQLQFEVYQSPRINMSGPSVQNITTNRTGSQVTFRVQVVPRSASQPPPQVVKVLLTYAFKGGNQWQIQPMALDDSDPYGVWWTVTLSVGGQDGIFFIQALDSDGNVTWSDNKGLLNTWVDPSRIGPPTTFRADLEVVGGCAPNGQASQLRLFLQAAGDELGTGVNQIYYRITYTDATPTINGAIGGCWGYTVPFATKNLKTIEYWAEDTQNPPALEGGPNGPRRQIFIITSAADSGSGTLRQALLDAQARAAIGGGGDIIIFNLPGSSGGSNKGGPAQIRLKSDLPVITQNGLTIDGLLPACDTSGGVRVELWRQGQVDTGLVVRAERVTLRGLGFRSFKQYALWLDGTAHATGTSAGRPARRCLVEKNVITDQGSLKTGIALTGSCFANTIRANEISRCIEGGILIQGPATANKIVANYIGTTASGDATGGQQYGVIVEQGASRNYIGGKRSGEANYISSNVKAGVVIRGTETTGNIVRNNQIGPIPVGTGGPVKGGTNQQLGVSVEDHATGNQIYSNLFSLNHLDLSFSGGANNNLAQANTFQSGFKAAIGLSDLATTANNLAGNTFRESGGSPIQDNTGEALPARVTFVARLDGKLLRVSAPASSVSHFARVELYVVRAVSGGSSGQKTLISLGSFSAERDGSLKGTLFNPAYLKLAAGESVTLFVTTQSANTAGPCGSTTLVS